MRLKVQTIKTLVWFGCAIAGAAILGLLVYIFLRVVPELKDPGKKRSRDLNARIQKATSVTPTIKARERAQAINWPELDNLHKLNVTGKEPPPPPPPDEGNGENQPPPLKPIAEVLQVRTAIETQGDESGGYATIFYLGDPDPASSTPIPNPGTQGVVPSPGRHKPKVAGGYIKVGDTLRDPYDKPPFSAKVVAIRATGIEFEWGGERVTLSAPTMAPIDPVADLMPGLEDSEEVEIGAGGAEVETSPRPSRVRPTESKALNDNDWEIGTDELERLESEGRALLDEIELTMTVPKSEKRPRLQMKKVPEGSLAHQRGFRDADILRTINGEEMSSKAAIIDYFKANERQSRFAIEIERMGSRITKVFTLAR